MCVVCYGVLGFDTGVADGGPGRCFRDCAGRTASLHRCRSSVGGPWYPTHAHAPSLALRRLSRTPGAFFGRAAPPAQAVTSALRVLDAWGTVMPFSHEVAVSIKSALCTRKGRARDHAV